MFEILKQSLLKQAICWDLFLYESVVNFLSNNDFVYFQLKYSNELFVKDYNSQILEILNHSLLKQAICCDLFLYQSDLNFLFNDGFVYF